MIPQNDNELRLTSLLFSSNDTNNNDNKNTMNRIIVFIISCFYINKKKQSYAIKPYPSPQFIKKVGGEV